MAERVFLHVGCPKTGTTFLQQVLWSQREEALDQGLLLPLGSLFDHFQAMVDVRDLHDRHVVEHGIWQRMLDDIHEYDGTVLISHELFAGTTAEQAASAVDALGPTEVDVIVTARDLARQLSSEWQEHVKHRSELSFAEFVEAVVTGEEAGEWFWQAQDPADILRRWADRVPPDHLHVVTVPPGGGRPDELWRRFATLLGLDPARFRLDGVAANPSLSAEQVMLLRQLNAVLEDRLTGPGEYPSTVKDVLAHQILAGQPGTTFALPTDRLAWVQERSAQLVTELEKLGCDVVGDLADLMPAEASPDRTAPDPDEASAVAVHDAAVAAIADLMERQGTLEREWRAAAREAAELRPIAESQTARADEQQARADRLDAELARRRSRPVRQMLIDVSESQPAVMRVRHTYWRTVNLLRRVLGRV